MKSRRLRSMLMVFVILLSMASPLNIPIEQARAAEEIIDSGYCGGEGDGTNISWTLSASGVLTVSGEGEMSDYEEHEAAPWFAHEEFDRMMLVLEEGITRIGNFAFADKFEGKLVIPNSVTSIGMAAFNCCDYEGELVIPDNVTWIGYAAFSWCNKITGLTLGRSVEGINQYAFWNCGNLTGDLVIPDTVNFMGTGAIGYCAFTSIDFSERMSGLADRLCEGNSSLTSVTLPVSIQSIGENAFKYCTALDTIIYEGTCEQWSSVKVNRDFLSDASCMDNALIRCTDGCYHSTLGEIEVITYDNGEQKWDELPLYNDATVKLTLENDWFTENEDELTYESDVAVSLPGIVQIKSRNGSILYYEEEVDLEIIDLRDPEDDESPDERQLSFQLRRDDLKSPIPAGQELTIHVLNRDRKKLAFADCESFPIQRWSFRNDGYPVSDAIVREILGDARGRKLLNEADAPFGTSGLCYGMAVTASQINHGDFSEWVFLNSTEYKVLDQMQRDNYISLDRPGSNAASYEYSTASATALELIQRAQITQYGESVQRTIKDNYGKCVELVDAIWRYQNNSDYMPVPYLTSTKGTQHAVCAYDYHLVGADIHISCYDVSFPYYECTLLIRNYTSDDCEWVLQHNGNDYAGGWSGGADTISYVIPTLSTPPSMSKSSLMQTNVDRLILLDKLLLDGEHTLTEIKYISGDAADTDTDATDNADADSSFYWLSGSGSVTLAELERCFISFADDHAIYTISCADAGTFNLTDSEVDSMTASGDTVALSCEYYTADDTLVHVTFEGASAADGRVSLAYQPDTDTITLTGAEMGTLTLVYDDEDDTTADYTWTMTVADGEPLKIAPGSRCAYDAATNVITLSGIPEDAVSVLIAAYADGRLLDVAAGTAGKNTLAAAARADELRVFYLDADNFPVAANGHIRIK